MPKTKSPSHKPARRGLTLYQERQLRSRLRRSACSETWVDDQIISRTDIMPDGQSFTLTCFDSRVFPPGGRQGTPMRWCRCCGRFTPRPAVSLIEHRNERFGPVLSATLVCDDCRIADDEETHRELYQAGLHLRPSGSQSFVLLRTLLSERAHTH